MSDDIKITDSITQEDDDNIQLNTEEQNEYIKQMKIQYTYPQQNDKHLQYKLYIKPEFYYNKIPEKQNITSYDEISKYRTEICIKKKGLREHQNMLSNFINPNTPFTGLCCFHELGSGKTCVGIAIAETFKQQVKKYNTKIVILVPSILSKEQWKNSIFTCTGETYLKIPSNTYVNDDIINKLKRDGLMQIKEYYKFMTHTSFRIHVLGERIQDEKVGNKISYKKNEEGEFERDISVDKIHNLDNTILIVDEAHNFTGNTNGESLIKIIKNSVNLKVVLLTATPMKNFADDIIELINYLRPLSDQIDQHKVFDSVSNHSMNFTQNGKQYLAKMVSGYVSFIRGADDLTYAKRIDEGEIPDELLFTPIIKCQMLDFQSKIYHDNIDSLTINEDKINVTQSTKTEAIANFIFPGLSQDTENIVGYFGVDGLHVIKNQIENNNTLLNKKLSMFLFKNEKSTDLIKLSSDTKSISGKILSLENLKIFSIKFYTALMNINELVINKKNPQLAFVYSNLVKTGIELFREILLVNGYIEYQQDSSNYNINPTTICYYCGHHFSNHNTLVDIPKHTFHPATFMMIIGKSGDDVNDTLPEENKQILDNVFNNITNKEGKYIKLILGSRVMNEGINLKNIGQVHILDVSYNFKTIDQTIGRGIRWCSHYDVMSETNVYPEVKVFKYVISIPEKLTIEEELYKRSEQKYMLIKQVERLLKENAIDCPLNYNANVFKNEVEQYKDCIEPNKNSKDLKKISEIYSIKQFCPSKCDFTKCDYQCNDSKLNLSFYDKSRNIYKLINKDDLDYTTFAHELALTEINFIKQKIKDMYLIKYSYTITEIIHHIKQLYKIHKREMYDDFFVYKSIDDLIPITENDFNNYSDIIYDKYNRTGYLIYIDTYYIFQPFNETEKLPMYYRMNFNENFTNDISLYTYLKNNNAFIKLNISETEINSTYDFDLDYYDKRSEYDIVGIIDQKENVDVFKIREKRGKNLKKQREIGLPSFKGAVCWNAKTLKDLEKISHKLNIKFNSSENRQVICESIEKKLLNLEKYSTGKTKFTYIMIPKNHPTYKFPYNLEDRIIYINDYFIKQNIKLTITKNKITIPNQNLSDANITFIKYYNGTLKNDLWTIIIE